MVSFDWQLVDNLNDQIHVIRQSHYTVYTVIEILQLFTGWPKVSKYTESADFAFVLISPQKVYIATLSTYSHRLFFFSTLTVWKPENLDVDPEIGKCDTKTWDSGLNPEIWQTWALRGDGSNLWSQHIFWRK